MSEITCPHCGTKYERPDEWAILRTADPNPPSEFAVVAEGITLHECRRGVPQ